MRSAIILVPLLVFLLCAPVRAHTLYFTLADVGDATVELEGMFSNGSVPAKVIVRLLAKDDGRQLWEGRTDEFGVCVFTRPQQPYVVELDAGPGHQARHDGI